MIPNYIILLGFVWVVFWFLLYLSSYKPKTTKTHHPTLFLSTKQLIPNLPHVHARRTILRNQQTQNQNPPQKPKPKQTPPKHGGEQQNPLSAPPTNFS